jgi:hypothetical protein
MLRAALERLRFCRQLLPITWLASLAAAFLAFLPAYFILGKMWSGSLVEEQMRSGLRFSHLIDLLAAAPTATSALLGGLVGGLAIWLFVSFLVMAGTFPTLVVGRFERQAFGAAVFRWSPAFLRLELFALLGLLPVGLIGALPLLTLKGISGDDASEPALWWTRRVAIVLLLVALTSWRIVVRLARVDAVIRDDHKMWLSLKRGLRSAKKVWGRAFLLSAGVGAVATLVLAVEAFLAEVVTVSNLGVLISLFVGQQFLMIVRLGARLLRTAGEVELALGSATADAPPSALASAEPTAMTQAEVETATPWVENSGEQPASAAEERAVGTD